LLPVDARVTYRAFGIVPDGEFRGHIPPRRLPVCCSSHLPVKLSSPESIRGTWWRRG
jgi:hypothetical protein